MVKRLKSWQGFLKPSFDLKSFLFLIDAYNLLFVLFPQFKNLEKARESLLNFFHDLKIKGYLVFDGAGDELEIKTQKNLKIFYTPSHQKADSFILHLIKNYSDPHKLITITSDNEVAKKAKIYGSFVLSCQEFIQRCVKVQTVSFVEKTFEETEENLLRYQEIFEKRFFDMLKKSQKK